MGLSSRKVILDHTERNLLQLKIIWLEFRRELRNARVMRCARGAFVLLRLEEDHIQTHCIGCHKHACAHNADA